MRERKGVLSLLILVAAFAAMAGSPTAARADLGVIVPSYYDPTTSGGAANWAALDATAGQIPVTAILNPDSGPSSDPNLIAAYKAAATNLEDAGGKVVAYVYTDNGNAPLTPSDGPNSVEAQINTYISQYGKLIDGFFIDGMYLINTGGQDTLPYYQSLHDYIKGLNPSYTIIGNPGQPYLNGVTPQQYLATADIFNIFEGTGADFSAYLNNGVTWYQGYLNTRFSNTIYDVPTSSDMLADLNNAYKANAGYIFVTDQGANGTNPYGQLPSYWDQEVSELQSLPEPSSFSIVLGMGGLLSLAGLARRWSRNHVRGPR